MTSTASTHDIQPTFVTPVIEKRSYMSMTMPSSTTSSKSTHYASKRPASLLISNLPALIEEGDSTLPEYDTLAPLSRRAMVQFLEEAESENKGACLPRTPYPMSREQEKQRIQFA
ncbi:hypothetical protein BG003_008385 [Podila horticola]|nr:hypothetical protein BG003_008385 [Podila horticola]